MNSFSWRVGLRYTGLQSGNRLLWFLSRVAIVGLVLSVALLITVLSVMNGFDRELRTRILSIVPHVSLYQEPAAGETLSLQQWQQLEAKLVNHAQVVDVISFVEREALLKTAVGTEPLMLYGMERYAPLDTYLGETDRQRWNADERGMFVSQYVAKRLGLVVGDELVAILPQQREEGSQLQMEVFRVAGIFDTHTELDKAFAWVHTDALMALSGLQHPQGFRLFLRDLFNSRAIAWELLQDMPRDFYGQDWSGTHGSLYEAVQMSRAMVSMLMVVIIAVAVFNVVSTLMLVVMEKKQAIAILQVMGANRRQVMGVFVIQGMMIGLLGSVVGAGLGATLSLALPHVVALLEQVFHFQLISTEIYPVDYIPADLRLSQVALVVSVSVGFSLLASCYPAWRAASTEAAKVLRYE